MNCPPGTPNSRWTFSSGGGLKPLDPATAKVRLNVNFLPYSGPPPDLSALAMEVTQGIQPAIAVPSDGQRSTSVPGNNSLIAGKTTIVRVLATAKGSTIGIAGVGGELSARLNGRSLSKAPIRSITTAVARRFPAGATDASLAQSGREGSALTFRLPAEWVARPGTLQLTAEVNGAGLPIGERITECSGCAVAGDRLTVSVPVVSPPAQQVRIDPWEIEDLDTPAGESRLGEDIGTRLLDIGQLLPLADGAVVTGPRHQPLRTSTRDCTALVDRVLTAAAMDVNPGVPVGSMPSNSRSCLFGTSVSAGGVARIGQGAITRLDNPFTASHELIHVLGLTHSSCDHGEDDGGGCDADVAGNRVREARPRPRRK